MVLEVFGSLSSMLSGAPAIVMAGSFLWGIASILLSPCHLASVPLIVGYISNRKITGIGRAAAVSTVFAVGIFITIAIVGIVTGLMGRLLGDVGPAGNGIVAVVMIVIGLYLMGIVPLPFLERGMAVQTVESKGVIAAFLLGLIFGAALGPCTFAYMGPVLGIAFSTMSAQPLFSSGLILSFALGHCLVIILAGVFSGSVQRILDWNSESRGASIVKKLCGLLIIAAGLYMGSTSLLVYL